MSNQIATIESNVQVMVPQALELAKVHSAVDVNAEANYAIQQLYKNEMAAKTAMNNPVSVQNAILNLSSIGISLNPALKHAYLVPRDGAICLDVSYIGLMHLAIETGAIIWGQAKIVYSKDNYVNRGLSVEPLHEYSPFGDRGEKVGVYCVVKLPNGDFLTQEMSAEDVNKVRSTSKSAKSSYSPWNTFEDEMWRKTVVKRASKYWPKSNGTTANRLDTAIDVVNQHEGLEDPFKEIADKFLTLWESGASDLVLFGYVNQWAHETPEVQAIYKCFPHGSKGKIAELLKTGKQKLYSYKDLFERGSESEIEEAKEDLTELELSIVEKFAGAHLYS